MFDQLKAKLLRFAEPPRAKGRPRIAVLLPNLRSGGAERMRLQLARIWLTLGVDVEFVVLSAEGELLQQLPPGATLVELRAQRLRSATLPLARYLRNTQPDVLLAALWPLTVVGIAAKRLARSPTRVVVSDHGVLSVAYSNRGPSHWLLLRGSLALGYRLADERIGVSGGVVNDLAHLSHIPKDQFHVVHNPAATGRSERGTGRPPELQQLRGPLVLSVGTLKSSKNQAFLVEAFSRLDPAMNATLCILGEGECRADLEAQIQRLALQDRVILPGYRADADAFYRCASVFALSSDHEGFGNVLVEALEAGVPIVSTDCPVGPREILGDNDYGQLVPIGDADGYAEALRQAILRPAPREKLQARAREFLADTVARRYLDIMLPRFSQQAERLEPIQAAVGQQQ